MIFVTRSKTIRMISVKISKGLSKPTFAFFIIAIASYFFLKTYADPDLWGHIKFGQDIYESKSIPMYDLYSYSSPGAPWTNHEWLSELIFFIILKFTGGTGLVFFKFLVGFAITGLITASVLQKTKSIFLRIIFILVPLSVITYGFSVRPQLFTYLLFTIELYMLDKIEHGKNQAWLFLLPLLFAFWGNLHGGFVSGLGVIVIYTIVKTFQRKLTPTITIATILSILATAINPYGFRLWLFLVPSLTVPRPNIMEWVGVGIDTANIVGYSIIAFLTVIGILLMHNKKQRAYEIILLLLTLYISYRHNRHTVLMGITAGMYIPAYWNDFTGNRFIQLEGILKKNFLNTILFAFSVFFLFAVFGLTKSNPLRITIEKEYPLEAIEFMRANNINGNILPAFNWAQMCIRKLPPKNRVFLDGRYESVYSFKMINEYFSLMDGTLDPNSYLSKFPQTDIIFLRDDVPLIGRLVSDKSWILVYDVPPAIIFLKDNTNNEDAILKFRNGSLLYPKVVRPAYFE